MTKIPKIRFFNSVVKGKTPDVDEASIGEIFINANSEAPFISTKDSNGELTKYIDEKRIKKLIDEGGGQVPTDLIEKVNKLMDKVFPATLSYSFSPTGLQEMGTTASVTISNFKVSIADSALTITSKYVNDYVITASTFTETISNSKSYKVKCVTDEGSPEKTSTVTFVYPIYVGYNSGTTISSQLIQSLDKQALRTGLNFNATITNESESNYLWIVSPYDVSQVLDGSINIFDDFLQGTYSFKNYTYKWYRLKYANKKDTYTFTIK